MSRTWAASMCTIAACAVLVGNARAASDAVREPRPSTPRSEILWTDAEAGFETANLHTFNANTETLAVGVVPAAGVGPSVGVGAGVRLVFLTLGLRGRVGSLSSSRESFRLWTLDAEAGVRVPLPRIEPHVTFAVGYAALGGLGQAVQGLRAGLDVSGANLRLGAGVDYYLTPAMSLGVNFTAEALALARRGVSLRDLAEAKRVGSIDEAQARVLEANGSSLGSALTLTGGLGVHF